MTLSSTVTRVEFTGNGSTTAFAFNYPVLAAADLTVTLVNAAGSATTQTLDSHYTVALASDLTSATVNMSSAPTGGGTPDKLVIEREVDLTQIDDFQENEALPSADLEKALDKLTMATQQLNTDIARSVRLPVGDTSGLATELGVSTAADRENKLLGFNAAGNALVEVAGRVVSVSVTTSGVSVGGSPTGSATFTESTGALALSLGIPVGATGATGSAGSDGVFSAIASQAEAEGGTENTKGMTALRTKQAVDSYGVISATDIGSTVQAFDADTLKADTADELTAGFSSAAVDSGTKSSGTFTPSPDTGNFQHFVNGGAHTLGVPAKNCAMVLLMKNNSSAGTLTTSGYTKVDGDDLSTTNGDEFCLYVTRYNDGSTSFSALTVKALHLCR